MHTKKLHHLWCIRQIEVNRASCTCLHTKAAPLELHRPNRGKLSFLSQTKSDFGHTPLYFGKAQWPIWVNQTESDFGYTLLHFGKAQLLKQNNLSLTLAIVCASLSCCGCWHMCIGAGMAPLHPAHVHNCDEMLVSANACCEPLGLA